MIELLNEQWSLGWFKIPQLKCVRVLYIPSWHTCRIRICWRHTLASKINVNTMAVYSWYLRRKYQSSVSLVIGKKVSHDDVIKWKHFPRNRSFVRGIHRSPVISPHKGQWRGALMFSLICVWINDWINNREAGELRRYRAHYDVIVMVMEQVVPCHELFNEISIDKKLDRHHTAILQIVYLVKT